MSHFLPFVDILMGFREWLYSPDELHATQALQKLDLSVIKTGTVQQHRALDKFETFRGEDSSLSEIDDLFLSAERATKKGLERDIYKLVGPQLSPAEWVQHRIASKEKLNPDLIYYRAQRNQIFPNRIKAVEWRKISPHRWVSNQYLLSGFDFKAYSVKEVDYLHRRLAFYRRRLENPLLTPKALPHLAEAVEISTNSNPPSQEMFRSGFYATKKARGIIGRLEKVFGAGISMGLALISFTDILTDRSISSSQRENLLFSGVLNLLTPWPIALLQSVSV